MDIPVFGYVSIAGIISVSLFLAIVVCFARKSKHGHYRQMPNMKKKHGGQPFNQKKKGQRKPVPDFSREHGKNMPSRQPRPMPDDDEEEDDDNDRLNHRASMYRDDDRASRQRISQYAQRNGRSRYDIEDDD